MWVLWPQGSCGLTSTSLLSRISALGLALFSTSCSLVNFSIRNILSLPSCQEGKIKVKHGRRMLVPGAEGMDQRGSHKSNGDVHPLCFLQMKKKEYFRAKPMSSGILHCHRFPRGTSPSPWAGVVSLLLDAGCNFCITVSRLRTRTFRSPTCKLPVPALIL